MFDQILIPLDGSSLAECVLPHGEHFARVFGSSLVLLEVLEPTHSSGNGPTVEPLSWQIQKAEADLYLQGIASRLHSQGFTVRYAIREGRAPENIVDFAHDENIDLVILATHGASGLSRWSTSSVTTKVLEKIYLPVLLVRAYGTVAGQRASISQTTNVQHTALTSQEISPGESIYDRVLSVGTIETDGMSTEPTPEAAAAQSQTDLYHRILLPIDCSRRAECALSAATRLVESSSIARLVLAAVIHPLELPIPTPYPEDIEHLSQQMMELSRDAVHHYLSELQARVPGEVESKVIEEESIFVAIHELAEETDVDLVILCAHGQTGGLRWPYGSVARNYIEYGTKSLLVIQDVPRSMVQPTAAETAAEKAGRR